MEAVTTNSLVAVTGEVSKIIFFNPTSKWGVFLLHLDTDMILAKKGNDITVSGNFSDLYQGAQVEITGEIVNHPRYGKQISIKTLKIVTNLSKAESIIAFLSKSAIKGISVQNAKKIYNTYEENSIEVVLNHSDDLLSISGIGKKTVEKIKESVILYKEMESLIQFATNLGLSYQLIYKLHRDLGKKALPILKEDIYSILDYTDSISFKQLDLIALNNGYEVTNISRLKYCFLYVLKLRVVYEGSTGIKFSDFKKEVMKELGTDDSTMFTSILNILKEEGKVLAENNRIYYKQYYDIEKHISESILSIVNRESNNKFNTDIVKEEVKDFPFTLNKNQLEAIKNTLKSNISVITGAAGTGKSSILKCLVGIYERHNYNVVLLAPTGKASRRIEECVGREAKTIHRFLGIKNSSEEIEEMLVPLKTVIFVDEASMCDIMIMSYLLDTFNIDTRLVLLGDVAQLESVGAGTVLQDIIDSKKVTVSFLTDIMRQAQDSNIITNCNKVNNGEEFEECNTHDFYYRRFYSRDELLRDFLVQYDREFDEHSLHDLQVITPYKKGTTGVNDINKILSESYNINKPDLKFCFAVGSKVMHIKNNYNKGVFNGEVGIVYEIDEDTLTVDYNGAFIDYTIEDIDELQLAYISTVHRTQGSEYPVVFVIMDDIMPMLLTRKVLYTALSRGKQRVYLWGLNNAVEEALSNSYSRPRVTKLKDFLCS